MHLIGLLFAILALASAISIVPESSLINQLIEPCPAVGPGLLGDFRFHSGCRPNAHASFELPEDKMRPSYLTTFASRMKPSRPLEWLDEISDQLLKSTHYVNHLNEDLTAASSMESCGTSCTFVRSAMPQCCQVETRLVYPMFGRSITSGKYVRIVQEADREGFIQPIVYRHCRSENTTLVRGRCRQSVLPRLVYVTSETPSGYPYRQDLISVPSNCECLVSLVASGSDAHPLTVTRSTGRSLVTSNIESSGESPELSSGLLAEDDLFLTTH